MLLAQYSSSNTHTWLVTILPNYGRKSEDKFRKANARFALFYIDRVGAVLNISHEIGLHCKNI